MLLALLLACDEAETSAYTADDLARDMGGYTGWSHPADWPGVEPSCAGAHGDYVRIWQNGVADADVAAGGGYSEGALFVLEGFQDTAGTRKMTVAMRKLPGGAGAWFWGLYDEAGAAVQTGDLAGCAACHAAGDGRVRHAGVVPPEELSVCRETPDTAIPAPG